LTEIGGSEDLNALVFFKGEEITRVVSDEVVCLSTDGGGKKFIVIGLQVAKEILDVLVVACQEKTDLVLPKRKNNPALKSISTFPDRASKVSDSKPQ
jgi:hypothetical protein